MGNRYYPIDGKEYASVTTITGMVDKSDALIPWAVNCAVEYFRQNSDESDSYDLGMHYRITEDVFESARTEWRTVRDEAGDIGTQVHDALEAWLLSIKENRIYTQEEAMLINHLPDTARELFMSAKKKIDEVAPIKVLATEQKVVNEDEWYAGRFDALLEVDGETWLIDFKTGASFYPEWGMQLAAYAEAWNNRPWDKSEEVPHRLIDRIKVLRLDKKTLKAHWKEYGGEKDTLTREWYYRAFLGLRDAFYILKARKDVKLAFMEGKHG